MTTLENRPYFVVTELKYQLRTSLLVWFYLISFVVVYFLYFFLLLSHIFTEDYRIIPCQSLLFGFVIISIFFAPINSDIFFREIGLNMQDFLLMKNVSMRQIIISRIIANGILLICPQVFGIFIIILYNAISLKITLNNIINPKILLYNNVISIEHLLSVYIFAMINIIAILLFWFLFGLFIHTWLEFKRINSSKRTIIYYLAVSVFIGIIIMSGIISSPISDLIQLNLFDIFFSISAYKFALFTISLILIVCAIIFYITKRMITICLKRMTTSFVDSNSPESTYILSNLKYFSSLKTLKTTGKNGGMVFVSFILISIISLFIDPLLILPLFFTIVSIYMLFFLFPNIIIERYFNMEELMVTRITSFCYMKTKCKIFLERGFLPLILPSLFVLIPYQVYLYFIKSSSDHYLITLFGKILLFWRLGYLAIVLLLLWKFLSSKNVLYLAFVTILMTDLIGIAYVGTLIFNTELILDKIISNHFTTSLIVIILLFSRLGYLTSILLLLWRLLPSKNLFYTTVISILMIDIIGIIFVVSFFYSSESPIEIATMLISLLVLVSPILSNILLPVFILSTDYTSFSISIIPSLGLSFIFFLGSSLLIKADVRYE